MGNIVKILILPLIIGVVLVVFFLLGSSFFNRVSPAPGGVAEEVMDEGVTISEVATDPAVYEGLDITLEGQIIDWVSKRAFIIGSPGIIKEQVLVVSDNEFPNPEKMNGNVLALGDRVNVEVYGVVGVYDEQYREEFTPERENSGFTIYEGDPFLKATSVRKK